ncbi:amidohydrolase, partial [Escherichia coli]|nr:amidohydrolase [Escherichia coli]
MNIINEFNKDFAELCEWRHYLHQIPETGFDLKMTRQFIINKLNEWDINVDTRFGINGVVAIINGAQSGSRSIAFRIDMDALPQNDESKKEYASKNAGCSHACGHDGHITIGLAAARYLSQHRDFPGRVIFIFQPAEEIGQGARKMMEDGIFEAWPYDEIYGFHNMPRLPANTLALCHGAITGASDRFSLSVTGRGGHSSVPHLSINPVNLISQIITAWQSVISDSVPATEMGVLCVTKVHAG